MKFTVEVKEIYFAEYEIEATDLEEAQQLWEDFGTDEALFVDSEFSHVEIESAKITANEG